MPYTVIWKEAADQQLAEIWMRADDRGTIAKAALDVDVTLRRDNAPRLGEARYDVANPPPKLIRDVPIGPLLVRYEVSVPDRTVEVLGKKLVPSRPHEGG
jgi:hypothetical protein